MATLTATNSKPKWLGYVVHGVALLVMLAFLFFGGTKLMGAEMHVQNFARWGYPGWFMYVTGAMEVLGAILILLPKTRFYGAALLIATMIGAIATHLVSGEPAMIPLPLVLLLLSAFVAWQSKPVVQ
jgi:uncharacterized membrane protein YphA (DoxX/SURF4 family)